MTSKVYKWCAVPQCDNTSIKTPSKLFIYVPHKKTMRNRWLNLARRDPTAVCLKSPIYFCEDHFDMPNDMDNYMKYHVMGSVSQVRMKPGCIPTKFECQIDRRKRTSNTTERPYIDKKQRKIFIEECEQDFEGRSITTNHLELGESSSTNSGQNMAKCIVTNCTTISEDYTMFRFPNNPERYSKWLAAIERIDLVNDKTREESDLAVYRICERHFENKYFSQTFPVKLLKRNAIPSLYLPCKTVKIEGEVHLNDVVKVETENDEKRVDQSSNTVSKDFLACYLNYVSPNNVLKIEPMEEYEQNVAEIHLSDLVKDETENDEKRDDQSSYTLSKESLSFCQNDVPPKHIDVKIEPKDEYEHVMSGEFVDTNSEKMKEKEDEETETSTEFDSNDEVEGDLNSNKTEEAGFSTTQTPSLQIRPLSIKGKVLILSKITITEYIPPNKTEDIETSDMQVLEFTDAQLTKMLFLKLCDKFLPTNLATLVKLNLKITYNLKLSPKFYTSCLNLHCSNPIAYEVIENFIRLPTKSELKCISVPVNSSLNNDLIVSLQRRVASMSDTDRICVLCVGTTEVKRNLFYHLRDDKIVGFQDIGGIQYTSVASLASIMTVQGILCEWQQPVNYAFLKDDTFQISDFINGLIKTLRDIGLDVRAIVTDNLNYLASFKQQRINEEKPYFMLDHKKVYLIVDPKQIRNLIYKEFMHNNFYFNGERATWDDFVAYLEHDENQEQRATPNLTKNHIRKYKTRTVVEKMLDDIFTREVPEAMLCAVESNVLPKSVMGSIKFLSNMISVLNIYKDTEKHNSDYFNNILNESITFVKGLTMKNLNGGVILSKSVECLLQTLNATMLLLNDLTPLSPVKPIKFSRLTSDNVRQFINDIKVHDKNSKMLKCRQIVAAFQKAYTRLNSSKFMTVSTDEFLKTLLGDYNEYVNESNLARDSLVVSSDYTGIEPPNDYPLRYIGDFILKKCIRLHSNCNAMIKYFSKLMNVTPNDNALDVILESHPYPQFMKMIHKMESIFLNYFEGISRPFDVEKNISTLYYNINRSCVMKKPCKCFPMDYLKELFVRIRIYLLLTENNLAFSKGATKLNVKYYSE